MRLLQLHSLQLTKSTFKDSFLLVVVNSKMSSALLRCLILVYRQKSSRSSMSVMVVKMDLIRLSNKLKNHFQMLNSSRRKTLSPNSLITSPLILVWLSMASKKLCSFFSMVSLKVCSALKNFLPYVSPERIKSLNVNLNRHILLVFFHNFMINFTIIFYEINRNHTHFHPSC